MSPNEIMRGIDIERTVITYQLKNQTFRDWTNTILIVPSFPDGAMPFNVNVLSMFQWAFTYLNFFNVVVPSKFFALSL